MSAQTPTPQEIPQPSPSQPTTPPLDVPPSGPGPDVPVPPDDPAEPEQPSEVPQRREGLRDMLGRIAIVYERVLNSPIDERKYDSRRATMRPSMQVLMVTRRKSVAARLIDELAPIHC